MSVPQHPPPERRRHKALLSRFPKGGWRTKAARTHSTSMVRGGHGRCQGWYPPGSIRPTRASSGAGVGRRGGPYEVRRSIAPGRLQLDRRPGVAPGPERAGAEQIPAEMFHEPGQPRALAVPRVATSRAPSSCRGAWGSFCSVPGWAWVFNQVITTPLTLKIDVVAVRRGPKEFLINRRLQSR